jgi:type I restriction enzyme S subunit
MLSDKILRLDFIEKHNKFYSLYYLRSFRGRKEIESLATGNQESMRNIGQDRIKEIAIPFCSFPEQHAIVEEIETRLSVCDKMTQDIDEALEKAEALRQSILKKAFEGKLLNEKELAEVRRAEDWEPADVLLERIKMKKEGKEKR